jgi:acyl-homoserine-lactone acylase
MTLQFGPDGPVAEAILTYGNPDDPSDPAYRAGLEAFSTGEWRPLRFTESDVAAIESGSATEVLGQRG